MHAVADYLKPCRWRIVRVVSLKFAAAVLELLLPLLLAHIIDVSVPSKNLWSIWGTGAIMVLCSGAVGWGNITANRKATRIATDVTQTLRRDLFSKISALSCAQADRYASASLVSRLTNDTYNVYELFDKLQRGGTRAPLMVIGGLGLTFLLEPWLALIQLIASVLTLLAVWAVTARGVPYYTQAQSAVDSMVRIVRENAGGVRVIKATAREEEEQARFSVVNGEVRRTQQHAGQIMALTNPATSLLLNIGLTAVVAAGAFLVNSGAMPVGQIVAFLSYFTIILNAALGLTKVFTKLSKGIASARRIGEILDLPPEQLMEPEETACPAGLGMEGVSFSYLGAEDNLLNANFSLQKGETLGIMGPTGSGKTTLVSLLLRLYDADSGLVWVGGSSVRSQLPEALRSRFGVVLQNDILISGSVYDNISFLRNLPPEQVAQAAKTAQAAEFIDALNGGFDHSVEIRGNNFSGGQRQRLLIARALAGQPEILILDNADSALDYRTAASLYAAIRRDCPGLTVILISERVSSLRAADRILVLEDGQITHQGTHEELFDCCPRYRAMAQLQMGDAV